MSRTRTLGAAVVALTALSMVATIAGAQDAPPQEDDAQEQPADEGPTVSGAAAASQQPLDAEAPELTDRPGTPDLLSLPALRRRLEVIHGRAEQTRARINLLKEAVLRGGPSGTAVVVHRNKMGEQFRLVKLTYTMDGTRVFSQHDESGVLSDKKDIDILSGPVAPGTHTVAVEMTYRGHGYGPFKYLNKQSFTAKGSQTFTAERNKTVRIEVLGYEQEGVPLEQRPAVSVKVSTTAAAPASQ